MKKPEIFFLYIILDSDVFSHCRKTLQRLKTQKAIHKNKPLICHIKQKLL